MRCGAELSIFQGATRDMTGVEIDDPRQPHARTDTVSEDCLEAGRRR